MEGKERKGESRTWETKGDEGFRCILVGDQASRTKQAEEEFGFSRLCLRGIYGLILIC